MNDTTTRLIQSLADKLGTTAEKLWSVLIAQAPIDATISLFQIFIFGVLWVVMYKLNKKFHQPIPDDNYNDNLYDKYGPAIGIPMILGVMVLSALTLVGFFYLDMIFAGFFNPEYWALRTVLSSLSPCH